MDRIIFSIAALAAAYLLDYFVGDPRWLPHPVRLLGNAIILLEKGARRLFSSPGGLKIAGLAIVILAAGGSALFTLAALSAAYRLHQAAGLALEIYILFSVLAGGDLRNHVRVVERDLKAGKLGAARKSVAMLVSRDTRELDEDEISRAALESLFENSADGLVAPLVFAAIGGPVAAVFYKAVNTLDSMLGYMTDDYHDLGYFSARLDDILNFIPARLTALMILVTGFKHGSLKNGWRVLVEDHSKHQSPNSAWPEAAAAGVLGIKFGGADHFKGEIIERPLINAAGRKAEEEDIGRGLALFRSLSFLAIFTLLLLTYWLRTWEVFSF